MFFYIFMFLMSLLFWPILIDLYKKLRKDESIALHLLYLCVMSACTMLLIMAGSIGWLLES